MSGIRECLIPLDYLDYVRGRHGKIKAIKVGILSRQHHYLGSAQLYSVAI